MYMNMMMRVEWDKVKVIINNEKKKKDVMGMGVSSVLPSFYVILSFNN